MILIIDNYDSFTYNLYQALATLTDKVTVIRNDALTVDEIKAFNPSGIILSPGPGHPKDAGVCIEVIKTVSKTIPTLGVCLGHQAIGIAFGGKVSQAPQALHGKDSLIFHNRGKLFNQVHLPFKAARYHSLAIEKPNFPYELIIEAEDVEGNIMAVSHREYPIYGVQFHPESILTPEGQQILKNFMELCNASPVY